MSGHEVKSSAQLTGASHNVHAQPVTKTRGDQPGAQKQVQSRNEGAHHVVCAHHLRAGVRAEGLEDVVLGTVGQSVEEQVHGQQQQTPGGVGLLRGLLLLVLLARVQREDSDAGGHGRNDEVLVQRVAPAVDGNMQEHDGQQLAALGQQERDVVDVRETRVAERAGQAARDGDDGQGPEDARRGDDGRDAGALGRRRNQVDGTDRSGEEGLNRVEEDGEPPILRVLAGTVRRRGELLLEIRPSQAIAQPPH